MKTKVMRDLQSLIDQNGQLIACMEQRPCLYDKEQKEFVRKAQTILKRTMAELVRNQRVIEHLGYTDSSEYF